MAEPQMRSPSFQVVAKVGTNACPSVADLISYALGQSAIPDRQRIEAHLHAANCKECRSWIDQAAVLSPKNKDAAWAALSPSPLSDAPPQPENPQWQRQAFDELARRLKMLDEN